ncbi:AraC family transcriptional regulator [Paenibacillus sp. PR3]|uniref:AraC family transcriptional regulator n=1 Tax=Paenibacillus terricola TaxID=2763503 RepID=A0ABR8MV17_9BACL|nr:AraC family transcriptional regulator [Paenibacillus terricola]MBD3919809.1 AraC family transcriptional regulator [Paenibacillus terricola]
MKPLRKSFDATGLFPFALNYRDTKTPQFELPDHVHDWHELVYVHSGRGTFFIQHTVYEMKAGDLFVIPSNTIHRATPDSEEPVTSTAIFFSPTFIKSPAFDEQWQPDQLFQSDNYLYELTETDQAQFEQSLRSMKLELEKQQEGFRTAVWLKLLAVLHHTCRSQAINRSKTLRSSSGPDWLDKILSYVEAEQSKDGGDKLTLSTLAKIANVSAAHFSRVFRQKTGMNVTDYLTTRRIIKAKQLLAATDDKVSWIATVCGFDSMTYFHRSFKKYVGMSPAKYRSSHTSD